MRLAGVRPPIAGKTGTAEVANEPAHSPIRGSSGILYREHRGGPGTPVDPLELLPMILDAIEERIVSAPGGDRIRASVVGDMKAETRDAGEDVST